MFQKQPSIILRQAQDKLNQQSVLAQCLIYWEIRNIRPYRRTEEKLKEILDASIKA
jgi:hypothetical protein